MKFTLSEIEKEAHSEPFYFDKTVDVSELKDNKVTEIRWIDKVNVAGLCTIEEDEYLFNFSIKGDIKLPCARTLVDVPYSVDLNVTEIFTEQQVEEDDDELHQIIGEVIDLKPSILENILLHIPYRVFSNEKVLDEGKGWSYFTEEEKQAADDEKIDPRFAKVQELFDEMNED